MGAVLIVESSGFLCRLLRNGGLQGPTWPLLVLVLFKLQSTLFRARHQGSFSWTWTCQANWDIEKACKLIKNVRRCKEVPIILVCSKDAGIEEKGEENGFCGVSAEANQPRLFHGVARPAQRHQEKRFEKPLSHLKPSHHKKEKATIIRKTAVKKEPAKDAAGKAAKSAEEIAKSEPPKEPTVERSRCSHVGRSCGGRNFGTWNSARAGAGSRNRNRNRRLRWSQSQSRSQKKRKRLLLFLRSPRSRNSTQVQYLDESKVVLIVQDSVKLAKSARKHSDVEDLIFVLARTFDEATEWIDKVRPAAIVFDMELDCTPKPAKACKMLRLWADDPIPSRVARSRGIR